jgi:3',5'-cyclic AMP phosphodiesterase CpdA
MRIAHLSDLHLYPEGALGLADLVGRRIFGAANLVLRRSGLHSVDAVRAAVGTVLDAGIDHVIVTGDLTNLALEAEFALAATVLGPLGNDPARLSVIPGNHDAYTAGAIRERRFERWFGHLLWQDDDPDRGIYPAVKDLPGVRLILANSTMLPPPMCAFGRLGRDQLDRIERAARESADRGDFTILALHHNMHHQRRVREATGRLLDRDDLIGSLGRLGIDLVIHGHDHHPHEMTLVAGGPRGTRVVSCGSTSMHAPLRGRLGRFHVYEVREGHLEIERWQHNPARSRFEKAEAQPGT